MVFLTKSLRISLAAHILLFVLQSVLFSQSSEFEPKSKKDIEKENSAALKERKKIASSGIISLTRTKYSYKFGKVDNTGVTESVTRYDTKGNVIRLTVYNPADGKVQTITSYRYDNNGNLAEELVKKDDVTLKTVHRYNSQNNKTETVSYKANGTVDRKISYIYDETGLLLEAFGRLDDGKMFMRESYLYNAQGNIVEYKNNLRKYNMSYARNGNLTSVVKYQRYFRSIDSIQYILTDRFVFDYDRYDNLVEMRSFRPDSTLKSRTQYIVNESGLLQGEKEFSADGRMVYTRNLKYDRNQNLVEETGTDRALKFKNSFKYDSRGNRTEMITYDQVNEPVHMTKYIFGRYGSETQPTGPASMDASDTVFVNDEDLLNSEEFFQVLGARIIAPDGTYLGMVVADTANPQSIVNRWGQYGYSQSATSIFNSSTPYGGDNGIFSPFNIQCPSPPSIYKDGKFFTYLTDNDSFRPRSAPRKLIEFLKTLSKQN